MSEITSRRSSYESAMQFAIRQTAAEIARHPDFFPIYTTQGRWHVDSERWTDWTGGFFAGLMWQFYRFTKEPTWRARAEHYSRLLAPRQFDREVHDLGFIFLNSYRPWFEITGDPELQAVVVQAGRTLAQRFVEPGQYLHSFLGRDSLFIDIMMNVPIVMYAAQITGDQELSRVALAHCQTTANYLIREDGSVAHEGIFDLETGRFLRQSTQQGLAADTAWARGLAWSLYGFSQTYELTHRPEFLEIAERNAQYFIEHLPDDRIAYWDFCADLERPLPWGSQRDSSASAIAASGLFDLADQTGNQRYRDEALAILDHLSTANYLALQTEGWEGILLHGVYHTRKQLGVDESVMWGDYFFVEGLMKSLALETT